MSLKSAEPSPVKCPKCGSTQISDTTIDSEFSVTGGIILDIGQFIGTTRFSATTALRLGIGTADTSCFGVA